MNIELKDIKKLNIPSIIGIPISNVCRYDCSFCIRKRYSNNDQFNRHIEKTQVVKLAEKIGGKVEYINISAGYGEAFEHPCFDELANILHKNKLKIICYSNIHSYRNNKDHFDTVDLVVLSCNDFVLTDYIKEDLSNRNNCRISCLVDYKNNDLKSILELCDFCNENRLCLELQWLFGDTSLKKSKETMDRELREIMKNESEYVQICGKEKHKFICCKDPWRSLYFDMDGSLRKCCIFMESSDNYNIFKHSLDEIWNSSQMNYIRQLFIDGNHFKWCSGCPIGFGNVCDYSFEI